MQIGTNDPDVVRLKERSDRLTTRASEAFDALTQAQKRYGDEPSTVEKRAIATLQAEYDRAAAEAAGADSEYRDLLTRLAEGGGGAAGRQTPKTSHIGELRAFPKGASVREGMRPDGPSLGAIVRAIATGDASRIPSEHRTLLTSGAQGAVPGYEVAGIVDLARQQSVIFDAGAQVIPMAAPGVKVARLTSIPDVEIKAEAADRDLTDQAFAFEPAQLDAYSAFLYTTCSLEALEDVGNLDQTIQSTFARQLALAWDKYAFAGDGNDQPLGLALMASEDGINEVDHFGAAVTGYGPLVRGIGSVRSKFHSPTAAVLPTTLWTRYAELTDGIGQPLQAPRAYAELPEYVSDFVPFGQGTGTDEDDAIIGDFTKLLVGVRTGFMVEVNRLGAGFKKGQVEIRGYMRWGSIVLDPSAFCVVRAMSTTPPAPAPEG